MKLARICLLSLACVAGAVGFGVVANAAMDRLMPRDASSTPPVIAKTDTRPDNTTEQPAAFALASATSTPVDIGPAKVKTLDILVRDGQFVEQTGDTAAAAPAIETPVARVPLPRPRPATAPAAESA